MERVAEAEKMAPSPGRAGKPPRATDCEVAVIGTGPYGLSTTAHLKACGFGVLAFGPPMDFWATRMPAGMLLRSPRVASTIADPRSKWTLEHFEAETGLRPIAPLPLETFVSYGRWFQGKLAGCCDTSMVRQVSKDGARFVLQLGNGRAITTRRVVVAAGVRPFKKTPEVFGQCASGQVTHCYEGLDVSNFSQSRVAVIGAGQSALECAALLQEGGANVELIARIERLRWIGQHPWLHRLGPISRMLYSRHDIGPAGISRLVAYPNLVSAVPLRIRDRIRQRAVRPAGSPWLQPRVANVKVTLGRTVSSATQAGKEIQLRLDDGSTRVIDHVILGTGYRVDISGYQFLSRDLLSSVQQMDGFPILTKGFSSSIPGLHFVGAPAARSFGPLLNFVTGTEFASRHFTEHLRHC